MRHKLTAVINRKRYNTETAEVIASDAYWDGHNYERHGTNTHLYRTPKWAYFVGYSTQWQGRRSRIEALTVDEAVALYEQLQEHDVEFEEAFPGLVAEEE